MKEINCRILNIMVGSTHQCFVGCLATIYHHYGFETISFLGPKIWEQVPNDIKNSESLNIFKKYSGADKEV